MLGFFCRAYGAYYATSDKMTGNAFGPRSTSSIACGRSRDTSAKSGVLI